jgi:hypothetical protein
VPAIDASYIGSTGLASTATACPQPSSKDIPLKACFAAASVTPGVIQYYFTFFEGQSPSLQGRGSFAFLRKS